MIAWPPSRPDACQAGSESGAEPAFVEPVERDGHTAYYTPDELAFVNALPPRESAFVHELMATFEGELGRYEPPIEEWARQWNEAIDRRKAERERYESERAAAKPKRRRRPKSPRLDLDNQAQLD